MLSKRTWIVAVVFFLLLILVSVFSNNNTPKPYPPYLVDSPAPLGVKGLYTYLDQNNYQVDDSDVLPNTEKTGELRFLIEPPIYSDNSVEQHYLEYIEAGNTLILAKQNPDSLFGIETEYAMETFLMEEDEVSEISHQFETFEVLHQNPYRIISDENDQILLEDELGPIGIERKIGKGSLIILSAPDWFTNDQITRHQHLNALCEVIPFQEAETIIFDEYSLTASGGTVSKFELYPDWAYILLVQGTILAIFILWHQGKRFGPIIPVREETVRLSDERLKALAIWQLKGKNFQPSLENQLEYLKEVIRSRYGIPYHKSWQDRLKSMEGRMTSIPAKKIHSIAAGFETISQQESLNKQEYLKWSEIIDKIRQEVEAE